MATNHSHYCICRCCGCSTGKLSHWCRWWTRRTLQSSEKETSLANLKQIFSVFYLSVLVGDSSQHSNLIRIMPAAAVQLLRVDAAQKAFFLKRPSSKKNPQNIHWIQKQSKNRKHIPSQLQLQPAHQSADRNAAPAGSKQAKFSQQHKYFMISYHDLNHQHITACCILTSTICNWCNAALARCCSTLLDEPPATSRRENNIDDDADWLRESCWKKENNNHYSSSVLQQHFLKNFKNIFKLTFTCFAWRKGAYFLRRSYLVQLICVLNRFAQLAVHQFTMETPHRPNRTAAIWTER